MVENYDFMFLFSILCYSLDDYIENTTLQRSNFSYKIVGNKIAEKKLKNIIYLSSASAIFLLTYLTNLCICFTIRIGGLRQSLWECLIQAVGKGITKSMKL